MSADDSNDICTHFANLNRVGEYLDIYTTEVTSDSTWDTAFGVHRQDIIGRKLLGMDPGSTVLEVGCGIGDLVYTLSIHGFCVTGIDQSEAMIDQAKKWLFEKGVSPDLVSQGDLFEYKPECPFDAVVANGVIPYFFDQGAFLRRLGELVRSGGTIAVTHRNSLFNLIALNQGTTNFILDDILSKTARTTKDAVRKAMEDTLPALMEKNAITSSDEVFRSTENPLTISSLYQDNGFTVAGIYYTFIHPAVPRFGDRSKGGDQALALALKLESSWQGMFAGSQFLVVATKNESD